MRLDNRDRRRCIEGLAIASGDCELYYAAAGRLDLEDGVAVEVGSFADEDELLTIDKGRARRLTEEIN